MRTQTQPEVTVAHRVEVVISGRKNRCASVAQSRHFPFAAMLLRA